MQFDNKRWRHITGVALEKIKPKWGHLEVIAPFGFEVTQNRKHLNKILRKFYCYLGIDSESEKDKDEVADDYATALFGCLQDTDPDFYHHIAVLVKNERFINTRQEGYTCAPLDKLLDIQVKATNDIYTEYANYIIASLPCLLNKSGECSHFDTRLIDRTRSFQFYIMFETLFGHLIGSMTEEEASIYQDVFHLVNNVIQIFYSSKLMNTPPNAIEKSAYTNLVCPRITKMLSAFQENAGDCVKLDLFDFHRYSPISLTLPRSTYESTKEKIIRTYSEFI